MAIKLGNNDITLKVGSAECRVYLGDVLIESGDTPTPPTPSFDGKWLATYTGTTSSAQCDSSSAITENEITLTDLVAVEIGQCVTSIDESVFSDCDSLSSVTISDSVTTIGNWAFNRCSGLTSVTIGNGVTTIGDYALGYCASLTSVTIGSGVTSIGGSAFRSCGSLTSVTIGSGITSISSNVFRSCSSLTSITVNATTPPTLGASVFSNTSANLVIYVPSASVSAYKSAWSQYASRIQAIP